MKCTGVDRASNSFPLIVMGRGCFSRARTSAWSIAAEKGRCRHSVMTSIKAFVNEYRPGSGAIASQLDAEIVSVMLLPVGNVALAAPAQQSRRMSTSDFDLSSKVWMADHLVLLVTTLRRLRRAYLTGAMVSRSLASCEVLSARFKHGGG